VLVSTIPHPHSSDDSEEAQVLLRVGVECINRFFCQYKKNRIRTDFFSLLYFYLNRVQQNCCLGGNVMIFINPKTNFAFKKIFGSEQSKEILISFLNALLYQARPVIEDLQILNPYLAPRIRGVKDTYLGLAE